MHIISGNIILAFSITDTVMGEKNRQGIGSHLTFVKL